MTERGLQRLRPTRYRGAAYRAAFLFASILPLALLAPVAAQDEGGKSGWFPGKYRGDSKDQRGFRAPSPEERERIKKLPEAERKGVELIQRLVTSGMKRAFIAREVTLKANGPEMEQWVRWDPKQGMRRESVQSGGAVFLDNLQKCYTFDPRNNRWYVRESMLPRPQGRIGDILRRLYQGELKATLTGEDTVAGRKAFIVSVAPSEGAKGPTRRIWIDRATGIRLKNEEIGPEGRVFVSTYFLTINFKPNFGANDFTAPDNAVPAPSRRMDRRSYKDLAEANRAGVSPPIPAYLPPGFSLRVIEVAEFGRRDKGDDNERSRKPVITLRFGNGITLISLVQSHARMLPSNLIEKLGNEQAGFIANPHGGPERMYLWRDGDVAYMLFASLSEDEIKRIANSVR